MGGSMGSTVGEKFAQACERAAAQRVPLVCVTASGGARACRRILSLMQLPKTVCAVDELRDARCAFISVMTHPTTAGVLAGFANLGDVTISEPGALLAFTGPRVVQQTTREKLRGGLRPGRVQCEVRPRGRHRPAGRASPLRRQGSRDVHPGAVTVTDSPSSQAEQLKLMERLAKLRDLPLLRGVGVSGEMSRLKRRLDQLASGRARTRSGMRSSWHGTRIAPTRWTTWSGSTRTSSSSTATARSRTTRRSWQAWRASTSVQSSSSATRRAGTSVRADLPQLRDDLPGGLPQGDAGDGAGRPSSLPVVTLVDTPGAYPGVNAEQHEQGVGLPAASWPWPGWACRVSPASSARAARVGPSRLRSPTVCSCGERDLLGDRPRVRRNPLARRERG